MTGFGEVGAPEQGLMASKMFRVSVIIALACVAVGAGYRVYRSQVATPQQGQATQAPLYAAPGYPNQVYQPQPSPAPQPYPTPQTAPYSAPGYSNQGYQPQPYQAPVPPQMAPQVTPPPAPSQPAPLPIPQPSSGTPAPLPIPVPGQVQPSAPQPVPAAPVQVDPSVAPAPLTISTPPMVAPAQQVPPAPAQQPATQAPAPIPAPQVAPLVVPVAPPSGPAAMAPPGGMPQGMPPGMQLPPGVQLPQGFDPSKLGALGTWKSLKSKEVEDVRDPVSDGRIVEPMIATPGPTASSIAEIPRPKATTSPLNLFRDARPNQFGSAPSAYR